MGYTLYKLVFTYEHIQIHTSGPWHEVLSELPHRMISRTLCRMLCAFSKFHFPFSPILSGRFRCRRSKNATAFSCSSGCSASGLGMRDWLEAIFQSMHWMRTSTMSLLGSATCCKPRRQLPALALSIAELMSLTWNMPVYISIYVYILVYTQKHQYVSVCALIYLYIRACAMYILVYTMYILV